MRPQLEKVGKRWVEIRYECTVCGASKQSNIDTYDQHIVARIGREAGMPDYIAKCLLRFDTDMRGLKSYKWTEDDTVEFAKILDYKRAHALFNVPTPVEMIEQSFVEYVVPKLSEESDFILAKTIMKGLLTGKL